VGRRLYGQARVMACTGHTFVGSNFRYGRECWQDHRKELGHGGAARKEMDAAMKRTTGVFLKTQAAKVTIGCD